MEIAVSFLKSKFNLKDTINKINDTNADYIHVDVMDGDFVPNKTSNYYEIKDILQHSNKLLDIHLMVSNPTKYILEYKNLKPKYITIHSEINKNIDDLIDLIKSFNIEVGISINPKTSVEDIMKYLDKVDNVLVMSVEPGIGGQRFMDSILYKIDILNKIRKEKKLNYKISIDGGINNESIKKVIKADFVISGSYICMSDNYQDKIDSLRSHYEK